MARSKQNGSDVFSQFGEVRAYSPALMATIGVNETLFLMQLHYWIVKKSENIKKCTTYRDGYVWVFNTACGWLEQFPWMSESTLKRTIASLKKQNLIICQNHNKFGYDRTTWYRIDYPQLDKIMRNAHKGQNDTCDDKGDGSDDPEETHKGQNDTMDSVKMNRPIPLDFPKKGKHKKGTAIVSYEEWRILQAMDDTKTAGDDPSRVVNESPECTNVHQSAP